MTERRVVSALLAALLATAGCAAGRAASPPIAASPVAAPAAASAPEDPLAAALAEGDGAWADRDCAGELERAVGAFRKAAALRPGDPPLELRLARAEALRAMIPGPSAEARGAWDAVSRAGERALRTSAPDFARAIDRGEDPVAAASQVGAAGAEPLYWLAVGRLRVAQATGPMALMVTKDALIGLLERVIALDERVDRAGPHRWLGAIRAALPTAAGGGAARAREHFDRGRVVAPEDPFLPVMEAETLAVLLQDRVWFDALIAEAMARDPAKERPLAAEIGAARRMAEALAARRARLF